MTNVAAPGVAVLATAVAFVSLAILHVVSPEFQPSWRMVSEYANGHHRWLLSVMFPRGDSGRSRSPSPWAR